MDDYGITPQAPSLEPQQVEDEAIDDAVVEDKKIAQATYHPAWEAVEEIISAELETLSLFPSPDLISDEYKIEALARAKARIILINLVDRIHHAVESTERTSRKGR